MRPAGTPSDLSRTVGEPKRDRRTLTVTVMLKKFGFRPGRQWPPGPAGGTVSLAQGFQGGPRPGPATDVTAGAGVPSQSPPGRVTVGLGPRARRRASAGSQLETLMNLKMFMSANLK